MTTIRWPLDSHHSSSATNGRATRSHHPRTRGVLTFPQELIDNIIDELWFDTCSLRTCSVVSKSWTSVSQFHLFRRIQIGLVGEQETDRDRRLDEYCRFLLSSPHLRNAIRELRIYRPHAVKAPLTSSELALLLHYTPFLQTLRLQGLHLRSISEADFDVAPSLAKLPSVRTLDISGFAGSFWSSGSRCLFEMLSWFPQLRVLRVRMGALLNAPNCPPPQSMELIGIDEHVQYIRIPSCIRPLHLKAFHFDSPLSRPFLTDALRKTACIGSLTTITVGLSSIDEIVVSGRLIRDAGRNLLHLRLNLIDATMFSQGGINGMTTQAALDSLQLHKCTSLKTIRLDLPYGCIRRSTVSSGFAVHQPAHYWSFGFSILRCFHDLPHRLRAVTFVFMHRPRDPVAPSKTWEGLIQEIDWDDLNYSLDGLMLLEEVRFFAEDRWGAPRHVLWPKVAERISRAILPNVERRGIRLKFEPDGRR